MSPSDNTTNRYTFTQDVDFDALSELKPNPAQRAKRKRLRKIAKASRQRNRR